MSKMMEKSKVILIERSENAERLRGQPCNTEF